MEKLEFTAQVEKHTKNTIRFQEITDTHPPYVNTLYIQKWALNLLGNPKRIKVTIEPE